MKKAVDELMECATSTQHYLFLEMVEDLCDEWGTEAVAEDIRTRYPKIWEWMGGV